MAQYRQSGFDRFAGRSHDPSSSLGNGAISDDHVSISIRNSHKQPHHRARRFGQKPGARRISMGTAIVLFCLVLAVTALVYVYISRDNTDTNDADTLQYDDFKNDFLTNVTRISTSEVKFGHGSVLHGRDSRYWDGDDRRRDEDYDGQVVDKTSKSNRDEPENSHPVPKGRTTTKDSPHSIAQGTNRHGLYNEAGRNELKMYEERYEASLKDGGHQTGADSEALTADGKSDMDNDEIDMDDEYDDGIDSHDARLDDYEENRHDTGEEVEGASSDSSLNKTIRSQVAGNLKANSEHVKSGNGRSTRIPPRRRPRHHKFTPTCQLKFSNSSSHLVEPVESRRFARFSLQYTLTEDKPDGVEHWEPRFAGHQSLREREESFMARDQKINCGFVKGPSGYPSTGFDLDEDDARYISKCHIAVVSCIFGNSDRLRSPIGNTVSRSSRKNVCFVMFMDQKTLQTVSSEGQTPDRTGFIGFWKIVVVKNLPYDDMRRVGKIPKLLSHRLFPSARYSIWLDSKLRLQRDPILILEHFLWRKKYEYAISNHYSRHCVWEEVAQNKRLNKYNHTIIDQQFAFYQADGLKRFNVSDPHKLLPSNVPEGSFIIRAHTPLSNLFSCLWFNEVDRFTPRDQLSFAHTYHKLRKKNPGKPFYLNMFKDCERRAIAKLYHHRSEEKRTVVQETAE